MYQLLLPYDSLLSKPVDHWPFISVTTVTDNGDWTNGYPISDKYRELFDNIISRWHIMPLSTFDTTKKFIKINDLEVSLRGSLVLVYFELKHYAIRDKRTGCISTNTFSATATQVKIIEHGADQSASPYKSLMLTGPRTLPQSPTKEKDQINAVKAFHPGNATTGIHVTFGTETDFEPNSHSNNIQCGYRKSGGTCLFKGRGEKRALDEDEEATTTNGETSTQVPSLLKKKKKHNK